MRRRLLYCALLCHLPLLLPACGGPLSMAREERREARALARETPEQHLGTSRAYAHYVRAVLEEERGDFSAAATQMRRAVRCDPRDPHLRQRHRELRRQARQQPRTRRADFAPKR